MPKSNIVIATGCPNSGWETIVPALESAGLPLVDESLSAWYDELFQNTRTELNHIDNPIQPDMVTIDKAATLLSEKNDIPRLLADNRNLWLLDFWADYLTDARFLLFYTRAETAVAYALLQGDETPLKILETWQTANRHLLRFQRRHRDRAILLNAEIAAQETQALADTCRQINLELTHHTLPEITSDLPIMERLVANNLVKNQPLIPALQAELEARAQPLRDIISPGELQADELIAYYLQQKATAESLGQQLSQTRQENDTLKNENVQLLSNLEQIRQDNQDINARLKQFKQEHDKLKEEKVQLQSSLEQARQQTGKIEEHLKVSEDENELLLLQLHQVQEELEQYFLKYQALEQQQPESTPDIGEYQETDSGIEPEVKVKQSLPGKLLVLIQDAYKRPRLAKRIRVIKKSGLFDEAWYLAQYSDVAKARIDPIVHYLEHGAKEMRNPSSRFDTHSYLQSNPDVKPSNMNPLVHYIKFREKKE